MKAPFILTQQLAKQMARRGIHGRIVNFSSITAVSAQRDPGALWCGQGRHLLLY